MSKIANVLIGSIDPNPLRQLEKYPYSQQKIDALRKSMRDVGCWEGVIGRALGNRIELAFGHHRIEAARQEFGEDCKVPVIVRQLTDEQMLQFMGRENLEDWNADFLVMLESWEAAQQFFGHRGAGIPEPIEIAKLLGWARPRDDSDELRLTRLATACNSASKLIVGGYAERDQFQGLSIRSVGEICQTIVARHEALERMAKTTSRPAREVEAAKKKYGRAGKRAADDLREGKVAQRDIKGRVDIHAYGYERDRKRVSPLLVVAANAIVESVRRMLATDATGEKLAEIQKSLSLVELEEDLEAVKRISFECGQLSERSGKWRDRFADPRGKVVNLKEITS